MHRTHAESRRKFFHYIKSLRLRNYGHRTINFYYNNAINTTRRVHDFLHRVLLVNRSRALFVTRHTLSPSSTGGAARVTHATREPTQRERHVQTVSSGRLDRRRVRRQRGVRGARQARVSRQVSGVASPRRRRRRPFLYRFGLLTPWRCLPPENVLVKRVFHSGSPASIVLLYPHGHASFFIIIRQWIFSEAQHFVRRRRRLQFAFLRYLPLFPHHSLEIFEKLFGWIAVWVGQLFRRR